MEQQESVSAPVLIDLSARDLTAIIAVLLLSFSAVLGIAFNIGAMVTSLNASAGQAGQVATVELAAVSVASFATSRLLGRFSIRHVILVGAALSAIASALTILFQDINLLLAWRAFGGVGEGTVIAGLMGLAGRARNPEMTFGLVNGSIGMGITIVSMVVPRAIDQYGLGGAYAVYLIFACLAFSAIPFVPKGEGLNEQATGDTSPQGRVGAIGWLTLFGLGAVFLGHNALMAFAERIGAEVDLAMDQVGYAIAVGGLLTIAGPISAGFVGARFGSWLPVLVFIVLMIGCAYLLATIDSQNLFYAVIPIFMMLPLTMMPFFLGGLATLDPSGRLVAANPAFVTMGGAIGPVIGGYAADLYGFYEAGLLSIGLFLLGVGLMFQGLSRADEIRRKKPA